MSGEEESSFSSFFGSKKKNPMAALPRILHWELENHTMVPLLAFLVDAAAGRTTFFETSASSNAAASSSASGSSTSTSAMALSDESPPQDQTLLVEDCAAERTQFQVMRKKLLRTEQFLRNF